ncbi:MAG: DUF4255 domain-containing protein [Chloroflexota bacterium]
MSSYQVISNVSKTLQTVLWQEFNQDPAIDVPAQEAIVFESPAETAKNNSNRLSIWLYHITENEFVSNQPRMRTGSSESQQPPLALNLHYLITPFATSGPGNLLLLGKTMQVLNDNSMLHLADSQQEIAEELRIIFNQGTLEELSRVWSALREPYRLSVCYQIKTVRIDSQRVLSSMPVGLRGDDRP